MTNAWSVLAFVGLVVAWLAIRYVLFVLRMRRQRDVLQRGLSCKGRVVGIQYPFILDPYTRLYFEFVPEGYKRPLRACHIDPRPPEQLRRSLPAAGMTVTVRYLPDRPKEAVIPTLMMGCSV
ncbi:MAG: hypothetical protein C0P74_013465 [Gammaproteobacteria bacterium]|nr:hypothetical protein [Gammaproteobacteria bacterium]